MIVRFHYCVDDLDDPMEVCDVAKLVEIRGDILCYCSDASVRIFSRDEFVLVEVFDKE